MEPFTAKLFLVWTSTVPEHCILVGELHAYVYAYMHAFSPVSFINSLCVVVVGPLDDRRKKMC